MNRREQSQPYRRPTKPRRYFPGRLIAEEQDDDSENDEIYVDDIENQEQDQRSPTLAKEEFEDKVKSEISIGSGSLEFKPDGMTKEEDIEYESSEGEYVTEEEEEGDADSEIKEEHAEGGMFKREEELKKIYSIKREDESIIAQPIKREEEEEKEGSSGEEETDDSSNESSDEGEPITLSRPVFIPKSKRNQQQQQREDQANQKVNEKLDSSVEKKNKPLFSKKKQSTLQLIEANIRSENALENAKYAADNVGVDDVDDTDDLDPVAEWEAWKVRELARIRRAREELESQEAEQEELEMRRQMSEQDKIKEGLERIEAQKREKFQQKSKVGYMQKFHHRGAFYQEDELLKRDFTEAIEDDYKDKSILPKALQVRGGLGLKGRSKYRSLAEEDTTRRERDDTKRARR